MKKASQRNHGERAARTSPSRKAIEANSTPRKNAQSNNGVLASDVGTQLMTALQNLAQQNQSSSLDGALTDTQVSGLTGSVQPEATAAYAGLNTATAANGDVYNHLQDAITSQTSLSTLYKGFVSDIEDVDMGKAVTNLNQNQVALQAALQVTAKLGQLSLLNYLPAATSTG